MQSFRRICLVVLTILLSLSSCDIQNAESERFFYGNSSTTFSESECYIVVNIGEGYLYEKDTGYIIPLELDPIERFQLEEDINGLSKSIKKSLFSTATNVYILTPTSSGWSTSAEFTLEVLDLDSLTKTKCYQNNSLKSNNSFLGLNNLFAKKNEYDFEIDGDVMDLTNSWGVFHFFVYDNILYTVENYSIKSYNLKSGKVSTITNERIKGESLSFDGKNIYYLTITNNLMVYSLNTCETKKIITDKVSDYQLTGEYIYYKNISDNGYLYRLNNITQKSQRVLENEYTLFQADDSYIYYIDPKTNFLYRTQFDTDTTEVIVEQHISDFFVPNQYEKLFFSVEENDNNSTQFIHDTKDTIYVAQKDGKDQKKIKLAS